jgi:hypothetical protein
MPLSPIILDSPVLLFLGAGASAPLGKLLMDSFVKKLFKEVREEAPLNMLHLLVEFRGLDLEAIMGELDTLIGMNYASSVSGSHDVKIGDGSREIGFSLERRTATRLQFLIKHTVIREFRDIDAQRALQLYTPLFDQIFSTFDPTKYCLIIFTTNYDPAIEMFCQGKYQEYNLCDGFAYDPSDRQNYWHRSVFDTFELDPRKRNIVLFKIHGSTDWLHVKSRNKIRRGQAMYDAMDSDAYSNVLIYPATRKIATSEPFYSGYEYYQRCCERAQKCIAVGYSFRDYDALTRLRGASSMNEGLQLALVSPGAKEILQELPIPANNAIPMPYYFGAPETTAECLAGVGAFLRGTSLPSLAKVQLDEAMKKSAALEKELGKNS